jgi:hypothetical protein
MHLGGINSSVSLELKREGCLIQPKEQGSGAYIRKPLPVTIKK